MFLNRLFGKQGEAGTAKPRQEEFVAVFESSDRLIYYSALGHLQAFGVECQMLHDYRVNEYAWSGRRGSDEAIIRVKTNDAAVAYQLLVDGGYFGRAEQPLEQPSLAEHSTLDVSKHRANLNRLVGEQIKSVTYFMANKYRYDLGVVHSIDFGVGIGFGNGAHLWWTFHEDGLDRRNGATIPMQYKLSFQSSPPWFDGKLRRVDATNHRQWVPYIGKAVSGFKLYGQGDTKQRIHTDLIIETDFNRVAIFCAEEPVVKRGKAMFTLSISNEWALIAFDDSLIDRRLAAIA